MLLEWKRREYSKNKQGDFLRKITLNGVNLLNKTPQKGVFSLEITPQVSRITKNNPNRVDFASHKG